MISDAEILKIAENLENSDIDIKKTIENAITGGYLGEHHFYCTPLEYGGMAHTVPEILGDRYKSIPLDNVYYDIISKALDLEGIYISLAYCNPNILLEDSEYDEIVEYDDYDLDDDEYEYLVQYTLISADTTKKFKIYAEEGIDGHQHTQDIGIITNIIEGEYKTYFALRSTDMCMSSFKVMPLRTDYPKEHPLSLKNPINKVLIEMINDTIIFK